MLSLNLDASARGFAPQLEMLSSLLPLSLEQSGMSLSCEQGDHGLTVGKSGGLAHIIYQKKCEFFRGVLTLLERQDEPEFTLSEAAGFDFNGEMLDNSRDSVLTLSAAKELIMYSALMGLDNILLYNEETYEVPGEPYFGYLRMRYSQKDIRELNDFAQDFGVTIIPCVQTLAHLSQLLQWRVHYDIKDCDDILLCEDDKTYELIDKMVQSWRDCVDTDWINIGMDEAHMLGLGQYLDKHGYSSRFDIMCRHLKRVIEICHKYGFKPMMWSDMFFRLCFGGDYYAAAEIDPELLAMVPKDVMLVYWDYYATDIETYDRMFKSHLKFGNEIGFAGGAWKWSGFAPALRHSHKVSKLALQAARNNGVKTVFTTAWGDDGAEASEFSILPTLLLYAESSYAAADEDIDARVSRKLEVLTGYTLEEFFTLCDPNVTPLNNEVPHVNPCKYLFYQDILLGIFDAHVREDYPAFYADCARRLGSLAGRESRFAYLFDTLARLSHVLELKCDMGVRLKAAYEKDDRAALARIADIEIPELLRRVEEFYRSFRSQWYRESRPGGFDVHDIRIGGLERRIRTARETVGAYLAGELSSIPELEEERLSYDPRSLYVQQSDGVNVDCNSWRHIATANVISHH